MRLEGSAKAPEGKEVRATADKGSYYMRSQISAEHVAAKVAIAEGRGTLCVLLLLEPSQYSVLRVLRSQLLVLLPGEEAATYCTPSACNQGSGEHRFARGACGSGGVSAVCTGAAQAKRCKALAALMIMLRRCCAPDCTILFIYHETISGPNVVIACALNAFSFDPTDTRGVLLAVQGLACSEGPLTPLQIQEQPTRSDDALT